MSASATQSLALALGVGSAVTFVAARLRIPAVLPLLFTGVALGVSGLGVVDGGDLGAALGAFIAVAIGLLVFEGGLHLDREELSRAGRTVRGLLTLGAAATFLGAASLAHLIVGLPLPVAAVLGAILIVTGPTVVQPLLRRLRLTPPLHTALSAEAVLIDPIGVLAVVTTLEAAVVYYGGQLDDTLARSAQNFLRPLLGGSALGLVVGLTTRVVIRVMERGSGNGSEHRLDPRQLNLIGMSACMVAIGAGEAVWPEAGLVATTVCAVVLANTRFSGAHELRTFKEQLSTILVATLFVLLGSTFELGRLAGLTWRDAAFVAGVVLVVRPLCVLVSTIGSRLTRSERVFAAFLAPRGIVAASVAAIAAGQLAAVGEQFAAAEGAEPAQLALAAELRAGGEKIQTLTFVTIVVTVGLAAGLGRTVARALGVLVGTPNGVVIVGAHRLGRDLARALAAAKIPVRLVDANGARVARARGEGLDAYVGDATDLRWLDDTAVTTDTGWVVALTGNSDVDRVVQRWGTDRFGAAHSLAWDDLRSPRHPSLERLGPDPSISETLAAMDDGDLRVDAWSAASDEGLGLAAISRGVLSLLAGSSGPSEDPAAVVIGLRAGTEARASAAS